MSNYDSMENVLLRINSKYISLDEDLVKRQNEILEKVLNILTQKLKQQHSLFEKLYEQPFFSGSYYDGLKITLPDEYDINLIFNIPKLCEKTETRQCQCVSVSTGNSPGWCFFQVQKGHNQYLDNFIDSNNYMNADKWMNLLKGFIASALYECRFDSNIIVKFYSESGPAITLQVTDIVNKNSFDVDLAIVFQFDTVNWPENGYRTAEKSMYKNFFLTPKRIDVPYNDCSYRYWRTSFPLQERELINQKQRLKPCLRLLKKLRNTEQQNKVCSYYLKTIALWEVDNINWEQSLSSVFMQLLNKYAEYLDKEKIPYYWHKKYNLLKNVKSVTIKNFSNRLKHIIKEIDMKHKNEPIIIAEYILGKNSEEYKNFKSDYNYTEKNVY